MILDGKYRAVLQPDSLYGIVIEVYMGYFNIRTFSNGNRVHTKPMILCGYLTFTSRQVDDRVIQAAMAMVHFKSKNPIGKRQQLVAQSDPE